MWLSKRTVAKASLCYLLISQLSPQTPWLVGGREGGSHVTDWILWWDNRDWDPSGDLNLVRNAKNGRGQKWYIPLPRLPQENFPCSSQHSLPPLSPRHRRQGDLGSRVLKTSQPASHRSLNARDTPRPLSDLPVGLYVNNNKNPICPLRFQDFTVTAANASLTNTYM